MMFEQKRKWILAAIGLVVVGAPVVLLSGWTLDAVQTRIRKGVEEGKIEPWMPARQIQIAQIYHYSLRDDSAAEAFAQYHTLFYEADRAAEKAEANERAQEMIWDYANVLDGLDRRDEACYYLRELLRDWPDHPSSKQAESRENTLTHDGFGNWKPK